MTIKNESKEEKTDIAKLVEISEKRTANGSSMIRFVCELEDGTTKWYSNWKSVYDKTKFDAQSASKGDTLEIRYIENQYSDSGHIFNNFLAVKQVPTSTINQLSAYPNAQYAEPGALPF